MVQTRSGAGGKSYHLFSVVSACCCLAVLLAAVVSPVRPVATGDGVSHAASSEASCCIHPEDLGASGHLIVNPPGALALASPLAFGGAGWSPSAGAVPLNITFYGWARGGTPPYVYNWSFGDGSTYSSLTTGNTTHSFKIVGQFTVVLNVSDKASARLNTSGRITVEAQKLVLTGVTVARASVDAGQPLTMWANASGADGDYNYSWWGLPGGCKTANSSSLICSPQTAGTYGPFACVRDDAFVSTCDNSAAVYVWNDPTVSGLSASRSRLDVGESTKLTLLIGSAGSGMAQVLWSNLPSGCLSSSSLNLTCVPTASGSFNVGATYRDSNGLTAAGSVSIAVNSPPTVRSLTASAINVDVGQATFVVANISGGFGPYTYVWTGLPTGCTNANVSILDCKPTGTGNFTVNVAATDWTGATTLTAASINLTVGGRLSAQLSASSQSVQAGTQLAIRAGVNGGLAPFTYTYSGLPAGCLSANSSTLECSPSDVGAFNISVQVTDSAKASAFANFTLTVSSGGAGGPLNSLQILVAVGGALVAAAAIGTVLLARRRKSQKADESAESSISDPPL